MIDMVPKAISLTLVNYSKENLQRELLQELYKPEVLDELLKESDFVVSRRKEVVSMVQALNKAEEYVPHLSIMWFTVANFFLELWRACNKFLYGLLFVYGFSIAGLLGAGRACLPELILPYTTNTPRC
jgi:hypothetical protein